MLMMLSSVRDAIQLLLSFLCGKYIAKYVVCLLRLRRSRSEVF